MPRPKYDIFLNNEPLQFRSYNRSSSDDLVSRFGSAEKGETNLDMLKAETQKSFAGGMFQRIFDDPEKVSTISGAYYNEQDSKLYFASKPRATNGYSSFDSVTAYQTADDKIFFAARQNYIVPGQPTARNRLFAYYENDNITREITLPAAIRDSGAPITSLVWHNTHLFISGEQINYTGTYTSVGFGPYRIENISGDGTSATFVLIKNSTTVRFLTPFRGKLYGLVNNTLNLITGEFGAANTATFTAIKSVGVRYDWQNVASWMKVFNGAIWIGKLDGLFRFDGVDIVAVIDEIDQQLPTNYDFGAVWNGRLFYTKGKKLFRFDGTNIEMLFDFGSTSSRVMGLYPANDRLVIAAAPTRVASSDEYIKGGSPEDAQYIFYAYSGFGVYEYYRVNSFFATYYPIRGWHSPAVITGLARTLYVYGDGYLNPSLEPRYNGGYVAHSYDTDEFTENYRQNQLTIISSEMNNGYPSVDKMLSGFSVDAQALSVLDEFTVSVRHEPDSLADPDEWTDWEVVYQAKNGHFPTDGFTHNIHDGINDGVIEIPSANIRYRRLQVKVFARKDDWGTGESLIEDIVRIRSFTTRYTLQPRQRFRWSLGAVLSTYVAGMREVPLGDGTPDQRSAAQLRSIIYNSLRSKAPILFYDVDQYTVETYSAPGGVRTIKLVGGSFTELAVNDVLAFSTDGKTDWINARIATIDTGTGTITLSASGDRTALGGASGTIAIGDKVRVSRMVYVNRVLSDMIDISDNAFTQNENDGVDSIVSFELREL